MVGRHKVNLDSHRERIIEQYQAGISVNQICSELNEVQDVPIVRRTLERRLKEWGIPLKQVRTVTTNHLQGRLRDLYYHTGMNDGQLQRKLQAEGYTISKDGLANMRRGLGIYRRLDDTRRVERILELREWFEQENKIQDLCSRMGRGAIYNHIRQKYFNLSNATILKIYSEIHQKRLRYEENSSIDGVVVGQDLGQTLFSQLMLIANLLNMGLRCILVLTPTHVL